MSKITSVALTEFSFDVENIGLETAAAGVGNMAYVKGSTFSQNVGRCVFVMMKG